MVVRPSCQTCRCLTRAGLRRSLKHAHNDYEHPRPLLDALAQNFESVEADVWLDGNDIGVSHNGAPFKGSLKALYLDPLAAKARTGSLPSPFFLWLDLKQGNQKLLEISSPRSSPSTRC